MSLHHSNRFSNITKVKYFLPNQRTHLNPNNPR